MVTRFLGAGMKPEGVMNMYMEEGTISQAVQHMKPEGVMYMKE